MTILLATFGGFEFMLTVIVFIIFAGAVKFYFNSQNLKKKLDEVTKERDRLKDNLFV